jgi:hypothetical protein
MSGLFSFSGSSGFGFGLFVSLAYLLFMLPWFTCSNFCAFLVFSFECKRHIILVRVRGK